MPQTKVVNDDKSRRFTGRPNGRRQRGKKTAGVSEFFFRTDIIRREKQFAIRKQHVLLLKLVNIIKDVESVRIQSLNYPFTILYVFYTLRT